MATEKVIAAVAEEMEAQMFAPHELPLAADLSAKYREVAVAVIGRYEQVRASEATPADMAAFGVLEEACYWWPKDTDEAKALRAAYIAGAAAETTREARASVALPVSGEVEKRAKECELYTFDTVEFIECKHSLWADILAALRRPQAPASGEEKLREALCNARAELKVAELRFANTGQDSAAARMNIAARDITEAISTTASVNAQAGTPEGQLPLDALLRERDDFIVSKGLWSEFVASLPPSASSKIPSPTSTKNGL